MAKVTSSADRSKRAARSKAKVSVAEGKGGPGMATLVVVGDERAGESVRMMANNALGGGKR